MEIMNECWWNRKRHSPDRNGYSWTHKKKLFKKKSAQQQANIQSGKQMKPGERMREEGVMYGQ